MSDSENVSEDETDACTGTYKGPPLQPRVMSVDSESAVTDEGADVEELGRKLGKTIADLPEYEAFEEAKAAVEDDPETQEKIQEFERKRQEFMLARQSGDASQEDLMEVQRIQNELHSIPVMARFLERQEELQERLEGINRAISDPLSIDFGGEAGGCCQD